MRTKFSIGPFRESFLKPVSHWITKDLFVHEREILNMYLKFSNILENIFLRKNIFRQTAHQLDSIFF